MQIPVFCQPCAKLITVEAEPDGEAHCPHCGAILAVPSACAVFISYATSDLAQARQVADGLAGAGICFWLARGNRPLNQAYARHHERYRAAQDLALGRVQTPAGVNIATICTDEEETVHRTTTNGTSLRAAALRYGRQTLRVFGADADGWDIAP